MGRKVASLRQKPRGEMDLACSPLRGAVTKVIGNQWVSNQSGFHDFLKLITDLLITDYF